MAKVIPPFSERKAFAEKFDYKGDCGCCGCKRAEKHMFDPRPISILGPIIMRDECEIRLFWSKLPLVALVYIGLGLFMAAGIGLVIYGTIKSIADNQNAVEEVARQLTNML